MIRKKSWLAHHRDVCDDAGIVGQVEAAPLQSRCLVLFVGERGAHVDVWRVGGCGGQINWSHVIHAGHMLPRGILRNSSHAGGSHGTQLVEKDSRAVGL